MKIKQFSQSLVRSAAAKSADLTAKIMRLYGKLRTRLGTLRPSLDSTMKRSGRWIRGHREALCYYSVLTLVLIALGTAAYGYRNGGKQTPSYHEPLQTAAAVQAMPGITPTPEPAPTGLLAPVSGAILQPYAADELVWSDALGMWQTHPAVDFAADAGEAVVAAADGTVRDAYCDSLFGNTIVLDLGDGRTVRYASLNTLQLVQVGQKVQRGEVISSAGTCDAEGERAVHVHVEYYENGVSVDPTALFDEK